MRNRLLIVCLSLLLAACSIGPDYLRPTIATQPNWRVSFETAAGLADILSNLLWHRRCLLK